MKEQSGHGVCRLTSISGNFVFTTDTLLLYSLLAPQSRRSSQFCPDNVMYQALIKSLTSTPAPVPQLTMHATAALFANQSILQVDPPFQIARARSVNGSELHTGYCIGERSIDAGGR